jgi:hypothetical protein
MVLKNIGKLLEEKVLSFMPFESQNFKVNFRLPSNSFKISLPKTNIDSNMAFLSLLLLKRRLANKDIHDQPMVLK